MSIRDYRLEVAIDRMADHLMREGMAGASLRPLAAAAGTSDRMLLYYFANKDELLAATLEHVAARLARLLDGAGAGAAPQPFPTLLAEVWAAVRTPALQPYMRLWLELAAAAARGREPHRAVAGRIADGFLAWAAERLRVEREADRAPQAALLLATVDGLALLDAVGRGTAADRAVAPPSGTG
jgi:AcrR family transcriptional regulator